MSNVKVSRKRGRPSGRNRVPLSQEERRARNAQYERERRSEYADAMAELAEAAGCDPATTNPDILATVVNLISRSCVVDPAERVDTLRSTNQRLIAMIRELEHRVKTELPPKGRPLPRASTSHGGAPHAATNLGYQLIPPATVSPLAASTAPQSGDLPSGSATELEAQIEWPAADDGVINYMRQHSLEEFIEML